MGIEEFEGHNTGVGVDPDYPYFIVRRGRNDAGNMGAMAIIIHGIACPVYKIGAENIVYKTILVIIDSITGNFRWVDPHP